ncbi:MAG: segregation/condensation protein A [Oscillospiraceae bacterium]|nr:segregation/condensation protein A [Oscillospiraceae bacterium]
MERNPTFYVEAVVLGQENMEDFEGPLNLLLQLVSKNKIAIADIQIGDICDQYLASLEQMKEMDLEVASEFVQMASHLVYIKARTLLSADQEIPELEQLIHSMEELQCRGQFTQIKGVLEALEARYIPGGGYMEKPPEYIPAEDYQHQHNLLDLLEALFRVIGREEIDLTQMAESPRFVMPTPITYSVTDKVGEIVARLKRSGAVTMRTLFCEAESRSEVVATFVAVLELCKMGSIEFTGEGGELEVNFTGVEPQQIESRTMVEEEQ